MRRRVWAFIGQADIMISFQKGLPSMVGLDQLESVLPRNLYDDSYNPNSSKLPAALPDCENTQISFLIAKTKLVHGFARALNEINGADIPQWERILQIDRQLRQIYENVPNHYKLGQLSDRDSLVLVSARFVLASIHHKSLCVLHSRFLEVGKTNRKYLYSRRVCLNSAMSILRFQAIQNQEIPVDGRLRKLTSYQTSLAIHDYLLAATIICAELHSDKSAGVFVNRQVSSGLPSRAEMLKALDLSARIFNQMGNKSMEAYKAADVLGMLVKKLERRDAQSGKNPQVSPKGPSSWLEPNGATSTTAVSHLPTPPEALSGTAGISSSSALHQETDSNVVDPSYPQVLLRGTLNDSHRIDRNGPVRGRPKASDVPDSNVVPTWPEIQDSAFSTQPYNFAEVFPGTETSGYWLEPAYIEQFTVSILCAVAELPMPTS
jgi:hypothetical protein